MTASPETPFMWLTTGPTFTASRSLNRADSPWVLLWALRVAGSSFSSWSRTLAVDAFGGTTVRAANGHDLFAAVLLRSVAEEMS